MAVRVAVIRGGSPDHDVKAPTTKTVPPGVTEVQWTALATGDTGDWVQLPQHGDKSVHVSGTIGTSTVTIEGSNEVDGAGAPTNPVTLRAPDSSSLSFTTLPQLKQILEDPRFIRPNVSGGAGGTGITVTIIARRQKFASGA